MAESVDTRIVEAKFDSSQFEEGVDKTVKKLEELKKSLNLKDSEESVADLASKTSDSTSKMSSSLEKLENRLTTFTGMLKNKLLSGIADEVVGSIYKIKNSFESLVSSLSTGQISYGMSRYTEIMNSVRTLTFSGVDQSVAYETIERLGTYADQTSYSLDQLVSTMSKFKTAGADLDTAERMVIGASNAAASMGVNATDAARAYLNLQQAYSKGYMQRNDWQSFESLPMVGTKFNQAILDAAEKMGTLEKQADGTYKTINKIDKTVKTSGADAKGITAENLGTKLSSKWFNKKVMEEVFGSTYYFNITGDDASEVIGNIKGYESAMKAVTDSVKSEQEALQKQLENGAITNEQYIEQLSEYMGTQTIEKLGDDLKETAPTSAEIKSVISDYLKENEEKLKDVSFDDLYSKQFESYLDTLEVQMFEEQNKELVDELNKYKEGTEEYTTALNNYNTALEEFRKNNNLTQFGWEAFRAGQEARSFTDVLNTLKDTISRGWATSFELIIGQLDKASEFFTWLTDNKLANAIYAIGDFRNAVLEVWAGGDDNKNSGRSMMIETLEVLDDLIGRILSHFSVFSDDEDVVATAADRLGQNLIRMTRDVRDFVVKVDEWFTDERIHRIAEYFTTAKGIISTVSAAISSSVSFAMRLMVTLWPVFDAVLDNISNIIRRVTTIFNQDDVKAEDGLKQLKNGFENILAAVKPLVQPLTDFVNILGEIGGFFAEIFAGTVVSNIQFFSDTLGFLLEVLGFESAQAKDGVSVLDSIKTSIVDLGNACKDAFNFVFDFFRSLYDDLRLVLGMREAEEGEEGGFFSNILNFFETSEFIKKVKAKVSEVWTAINTFFFGEEVEVTGKRTTWTQRTQSEFSKMVENAITAINTFVTKTVPKYVKKIWDNITDFLFGKKIVAVKYSNGQYVTTYTRFKSGFSEFLDKIFNGIKTFITKDLPKAVSDIWNKVVEVIFGKNEVEEAVNGGTSKKNDATDQVKGGFSKWLTQAIEDVKNWILSVPGKIKSLWNTIIDVIFYRDANPDEVNPETGEAYAPNTRVKNAFTTWLESIPEQILNWIKDLPEKAADIWNKVLNFIFGKEVEPGTVNPKTGEEYPPNTRIKEGFSAWLATAVETVKSWIKTAGGLISNLWDIVLDAIFGSDTSTKETEIRNVPKVTISQDAKEGAVQTIGASLSQDFQENTSTRKNILDSARSFIESLGIDIGKILTDLPAYIVQGWNSGLNFFSDLATRITNWLKKINIADATENDIAEEFKDPNENSLIAAITEFGKSVSNVVTTIIPELLSEGWKAISGHSKTLWASIKSMFGIENYSWSELSKDAAAFGTKVADEIKTLPDKIRTAIAAIKNEFSGESFNAEVWKSLYAENPQYADEYQKSFADKQKNGLWEAIKSIFGSIGDVIVDFGPDILEGINKVLEWLGEKITMVTEIFADKKEDESIGEAVARHMGLEGEENKEPSGIAAALTKIGQTIYDLIVKIIPGFIEAGISVLAQEIPKLINKIGTMFNGDAAVEAATAFIEDFTGEQAEQSETVAKSARAAEKNMEYVVAASPLSFMNQQNVFNLDEAKEGNENTKNVKDIALDTANNIGGIIGAFKDLATSDTGRTIAMILAISLLISKLRDLASSVNFSDTFEAAAKAAKWEAIKTVIMFVTGLLTYVTILAATGNEDQLAKVEEIFSKFESFVDKLMSFTTTISAILGMTSVSKIIRTISDAKSGITTAITGFTGGFGAAIGTAASKFAIGTTVASIGGSMITESIQNWIGDISASFGLIKTGLDSLLEAIGDLPEIKTRLEESGDAVVEIGKFLSELSHVFDEKTLVTTGEGDVQEKYTSFRGEIEEIMGTFTQLSGTMATFRNSVSGKYIKAGELVKSLDDLMEMQSKMVDFAAFSATGDFEQFKYAIASLGSALSMYSGSGFVNAELKDENITTAVDAIIKILQNEKMTMFASELESSGNALPDAKDVYAQSEKIVMLAGAIGSIGEAAKNINKNTGTYIQTLFETLASIDFGLVDGEEGEDRITKFAQNFGVIGNAIGTFANEAKGFTQENVDVTKDAIDLTIKLMSALAQYSQGAFDKVFNGDASIEQFGTNFKTFANQLYAALQVLAGENVSYNQQALEQSMYAFRSVVISYSELNRYFSGKVIATTLHLNDIFPSAEEAKEFAERLSTFSSVISKADMNTEDFRKVYVVLDVLKALSEHAVMSKGVTFWQEMEDLAQGLNPSKDEDNIFVALTSVIKKVKDLTTTYEIDDKFIDYFEGFGNLFNGIASLATSLGGGANYVTTQQRQKAISGTIEGILELFSSLNDRFPVFEEMVKKVASFDNAEIEKSKNFFAALKDLAVSLNYFKDTDIYNGLDNLQYFDWSTFLDTLKTSMLGGISEEDFYTPKITPVLEITDDFLAKANQIRSLLGYDKMGFENGELTIVSNNNTSLDLANQLEMPTAIDYTNQLAEILWEVRDAAGNVRAFEDALRNTRFVIYGDRLTDVIGPSMDEWLGREGFYVARRNAT